MCVRCGAGFSLRRALARLPCFESFSHRMSAALSGTQDGLKIAYQPPVNSMNFLADVGVSMTTVITLDRSDTMLRIFANKV